MKPAPRVAIVNAQRAVKVDCAELALFGARAVARVLKIPARRSALRSLEEVSLVLVSDCRMATLHRQFLGLAGPTDVITFAHGEIFISTQTARRQARQYHNSLGREIRLYLVHGLLHLHGSDDKTAAAARKMARLQEQIVAEVLRAGARV